MDTISYSEFRNDLDYTLDKVNDEHKPVLVTRQRGEPAVVMSLEDFQAYEEMAYQMIKLKNAECLKCALAEAEKNTNTEQDS